MKVENSIEEDIKILEEFIKYYEAEATSRKFRGTLSIRVDEDDIDALENLINMYKRVLKENEIYKKNSEIMSKENLSTAEQLKVEIKENFRLKNQLENNRKEYQETYKDIREELGELKKENEELKNNTRKNENELEFDIDCDWIALQKILDESEKSNEYISYKNEKWIKEKYCIPIQKVKDIIDRIDYDIKKTKEIISNGRRNDYQTVRLRAMNTKSLDIKKRLQKLLESEE